MTVVSFDGINKLNGIFFMWGANGENLNSLVEVSASSTYITFSPSNVLDQTSSAWFSNSESNHWISFHLLKHNLSLSRYSFKQYGNSYIVKTWIFEVSSDGHTWIEIDNQEGEIEGICTANSIHSFPASSNPYSFFRLRKTQSTCNGGTYVRIYSFELFGTLINESTNIDESSHSHHRIYHLTCDFYSHFSFILIFILTTIYTR